MQFRLIGERKSDLTPTFGPALTALLAAAFDTAPVFPRTRRHHSMTSMELIGLIALERDEEARTELQAEYQARLAAHGYFFIEPV